MEVNITKETCKRIAENPSSTEMERILAQYAIRLHNRIGKVENDANDLKNTIKSIVASIFNNAPFLVQQEAKNHGFSVIEYRSPEQVIDLVKNMFPPINPPFKEKEDNKSV